MKQLDLMNDILDLDLASLLTRNLCFAFGSTSMSYSRESNIINVLALSGKLFELSIMMIVDDGGGFSESIFGKFIFVNHLTFGYVAYVTSTNLELAMRLFKDAITATKCVEIFWQIVMNDMIGTSHANLHKPIIRTYEHSR